MIFNNLGLSDLSPELELFLWEILGCTLLNSFNLSTDITGLKVTLCTIDFCLVDCHDCNFFGFVFSESSCAGSMASNPIPSSLVLFFFFTCAFVLHSV